MAESAEEFPSDTPVAVITRDGDRASVPFSDVDRFLKVNGGRVETIEESEAHVRREGAKGRGLETAAASFASGITGGGSDVALGALSPEWAEEQRLMREENAGANVAGAALSIVPSLFTGGAGAAGRVIGGVPGLANAAGAAVGRGVAARAGTGVAGRALASGARYATEGVITGAGMGVSQVGLQSEPKTWEGALSTIGSAALYGGATGGALGVSGSLLATGARAAKAGAGNLLARARGEAVSEGAEGALAKHQDILAMDKRQAAIFEEGEKVAAAKAKAEGIKGAVGEVEAQKVAWEAEKDAAAGELFETAKNYKDVQRGKWYSSADSEVSKKLGKANRAVMSSLDDGVTGFAKDRGARASKALIKQRGALEHAIEDATDPSKVARNQLKFKKNFDSLPRSASQADTIVDRAVPAARGGETVADAALPNIRDEAVGKLNPDQSRWYAKWYEEVTGEPLKRTGKGSLKAPMQRINEMRVDILRGKFDPRGMKLDELQELLAHNKSVYDDVQRLQVAKGPKVIEAEAAAEAAKAADATTERLEAVRAHRAKMSEPSMGERLFTGALAAKGAAIGGMIGGIPGAFIGGAAGKAGGSFFWNRLVRGLGRGTKARDAVIKSSVTDVLSKSVKAGKRTVPIASKILPMVRYASQAYVNGVLGESNAKPSKSKNVELMRERARELEAITEPRPGGGYQMKLDAWKDLTDRLAGVWDAMPELANGIEKAQVAVAEFLASKVPRDPSPPYLQVGPATWEPSHAEVAKFARMAEVCETPEVVAQRVAEGTVTADDIEALEATKPAMLADLRQRVMTSMAGLKHQLPESRRLNLSILLGLPLVAALTPEALSVYQRERPAQGAGPGGMPQKKPGAMKNTETNTNDQRYSAK